MGKLHLTKALFQAALKYYNARASVNFSDIKVLMLTLTSKAAYNVQWQ